MHSIKRPQSVFFISPEILIEYQDLTKLPYLYDETVLECIVHRYKEDSIYTWAGPILVAVNPFRTLDGFYTEKLMQTIYTSIKSGNDSQNPHVYCVAGLAHHRLVSQIGLINQAILVSGESGAGKTESAKHLLTYLTKMESETLGSPLKGVWQGKQPRDVQRRIIASNPILEAFGNSATSRNHNSSRFGKLVRLQYNGPNLKGAEINTYLLEKTRVTSQPTDERNFHIFYQFLSAINNGALCDFSNLEVASFVIAPKFNPDDDSKDYDAFLETKMAFDRIGVSHNTQMDIFKVVAILLLLGNIMFDLDARKEFWTVAQDDENKKTIANASELLGLKTEDLTEVLTIKKISVVTSGKETVFNKSCERKELCEERRDALMQLLYSFLFSHLVSIINSNTKVDSVHCSSFLGILDVYGFETFDQNSLEQLCINYTNERLQQEFTRRYLAMELRILSEEGFLDFPLIYTDNARCVSILDSAVSVFSILNEECQLRRALNEESTCERVCKALQSSGLVLSPHTVKNGFIIKHYAGHVNYSSNGLLHKNKDEVPKDIYTLCSKSTNKFLSLLSIKEEDEAPQLSTRGTPTRRLRKITTLSKFKSSLDSLMKILTSCDLHYVRCLKPNEKSVPCYPNEQFLHDQLRSNGILETVKISQAGYPVRMLYKEFLKRYNFSKLKLEDRNAAITIASRVLGTDGATSPPIEKCRFGKTRIFLSENGLHFFELLRTEQKIKSAICIQKYVRKQQTMKKYRATLKLLSNLQRRIKTWLCVRRYKKILKAVVVIQSAARTWTISKSYQKMRKAAITIQRHVRGWRCRKMYAKAALSSSLRSSSRASHNSLGYFSMATFSSLTDNSISDVETMSLYDDAYRIPIYEEMRLQQRLLETEESGLETDTESLSGEGLKAGRVSKFYNRRQLTSFNAAAAKLHNLRLSDDDLTQLPAETRTKPRLFPTRMISRSIRAQLQKKVKEAQNKEEQLHKLRVATLKHFQRVPSSSGEHKLSFELSLLNNFPPIFCRDGIISYRQMPKVMIKFHTRRTCLPFSTIIPFQERPQGLIDAVR